MKIGVERAYVMFMFVNYTLEELRLQIILQLARIVAL
jgi:hypothetical protein